MGLVTTLRFGSPALLGAAFLIALTGISTARAQAGVILEERKLPMRFVWNDCKPSCGGWVSAVGVVTSDTSRDFNEFAHGRNLAGATMVLDSSGGSVNDAITIGRRWRQLGLLTTVGTTVEINVAGTEGSAIVPGAYCESMCVFLLLSGKNRYVPDGVHVRVHQIWMGDRADDPRAASYTAQDLTIVERDIGRLAKFTFDMGGTGDLLSLALSVPPWEELHELSASELRLTNLVTTDLEPAAFKREDSPPAAVADLKIKPLQERFSDDADTASNGAAVKPTKTAEAHLLTGGIAPAGPSQ